MGLVITMIVLTALGMITMLVPFEGFGDLVIILIIIGLTIAIIRGMVQTGKRQVKLKIEPTPPRLTREQVRQLTNERVEKEFESQNFNPTKKVYSSNEDALLAFDENSKKLCIVRVKGIDFSNNDGIVITYYSHKDLLESHIVEDGVSTTRTSRSSQVGGALLGGILAGGVGAIIGGLSGKTTTSVGVKNVKLQIVVNNTANPIEEFSFLNRNLETKKDSPMYQQVITSINYWHKLIGVLITQADKEDKEESKREQVQNGSHSSLSVSEEIRKFHELYQEGIITKDEFDLQKKKLMT